MTKSTDLAALDHTSQFEPFNTDIPLDQLLLSSLNVRQTERDADVASLAENIAAGGLEQNLIVVPAHFTTGEEAASWAGKFEVVGGGRRLHALRLLVASDRLAADWPVPCKVKPRDTAQQSSLSENFHRWAMNPADEFAAFAQIAAAQQHAGSTPAESIAAIAKRFGVTQRHVEGRLRLASLHPDILAALRTGAINLDAAKAYAGTTDQALQLKVFTAQAKQPFAQHPRTIRDALRGKTRSLDDGRVKFIGLDAYRAAGGRTEAEMFMGTDGEERVTDLALLDRLCAEAAEPLLARQAKADGFKSGLFAPGCGHTGMSPKCPDGYEKRGYEFGTPTKKVLKQRIAIYSLTYAGDGLYLIDQFKPKDEVKPAERSGYQAVTPEERAARERAAMVDCWAARLAIGPFAGTPLEGRAFWPNTRWLNNTVEHEYDEADENETLISALVTIKIRVEAADIAAARDAAEAKVAEIEAEQAERAARMDAAATADGDDADVQTENDDEFGED